MPSIGFAIFAALAFGVWTVFHKIAAPHINQVFGAIVVSFTAVIFGLAILISQLKGVQLITNPKGLFFLIFAGIAAFFIDFFALQAYSRGLQITVGGPIIIGGSIAVAAIIGFAFGEQISALKLFALFLILVGSGLLARFV